MSYETVSNTIRSRFNTEWGTSNPTVTVAWGNVEFDPPNAAWVRFSIVPGESFQASLGSTPYWRHAGAIIVQCFDLVNKGEKDALNMADDAASIFRGWQSGSILCKSPFITTVGPDGKYFQINMTVPFQFDERLAAAT